MSCRCTNIVAVAVASCVFLIIADTAASQYPADAANRTRHTIRRRLLQRRAAGVASSQRDECVREKRPSTDLLRLLPSPANADFHRHDGRCAYRYKQLNAAWAGCIAEPLCVGVVRDNGLACGGRQASHPFELRGGGASRGASTNAWVCGPRLRAVEQAEAEARPPPQVPPEGFLYVLHGGCAVRDYGCNHVLEMATSVASIRALPPPRRPIAVLSDGGIPAVWLRSRLGSRLVAIWPRLWARSVRGRAEIGPRLLLTRRGLRRRTLGERRRGDRRRPARQEAARVRPVAVCEDGQPERCKRSPS